jgi:peptide/nickel transport system ATP-binding protein
MTTPSLLSVEGLTVTYATRHGPLRALDDVDFAIEPGETLALVGESGSGKSTVALAILGLLDAGAATLAGSIVFKGRDLPTTGENERRALRGQAMSVVFQDPFTSLNPGLPVGLQVAEPLIYHRGVDRREAEERAVAALHEVGLPSSAIVARAYPHQLSGGMRQRVLIAMALICDPELLILDEPTTALDVTVEAQILDLLDDIRQRRGLAMLFITHNLGVVNRIADRICVLYAGRVLEVGAKNAVLGAPSHPYTKGLLAALPRLMTSVRERQLAPISGRFPDMTQPPPGCIFEPRCPFVEAACHVPQKLAPTEDRRLVRCWKAAALAATPWPLPAPANAGAPQRHGRVDGALLAVSNACKAFYIGGSLAAVKWTRVFGFVPWPRLDRATIRALDGASIAVARGEVLGLVGESGSGKTTLGRAALRLLGLDSGRIAFAGDDITTKPPTRMGAFRKQAQIVFQNPESSLNPRRTVGAAIGRAVKVFVGLDGARRRARVEQLLDRVGLPRGFYDRYPHQLSGGEKQRIGIARALAGNPDFIVCDEPVSALDVSVQATVLNLLAELKRSLGLSYLFISHDLSVVAYIADRIAVMYAGRICEEGSTAAVLAPPYHPYTEALLSAVPLPEPGVVGHPRIPLRGDVADRPTNGCPFHPRCPRKLGSVCENVTPPIIEPAAGHRIACHIPLESLCLVPSVVPGKASRRGGGDD